MRILGIRMPFTGESKALQPVDHHHHSFFGLVKESFTGAWQKNVEIRTDTCLTFSAVYACITLIAGDIGKIRLNLTRNDGGVWLNTERSPFSPVLRKPNHYQTRVSFIEQWVTSKLIHGNTYVLKQRDNRGIVTALYILDPCKVRVFVSDVDGRIFYQLGQDDITRVREQSIFIPASEIIHDVHKPLHHPLVGVSPLTAACLAAAQGLEIQKSSAKFFANGGNPSGILTAPGAISRDTSARLEAYWNENFTGENSGKVALLGDGVTFNSVRMTSVDAQMLELLRWTAENVAMTFLVPPFKLGLEPLPSAGNIQSLNVEYYQRALQTLIENIEARIDEGLSLPPDLRSRFDVDDLMRMDTATQFDVLDRARSVLTLDERRSRVNRPTINGGNTIYLQQQDHSLEAIAARDQMLIDQSQNPEPEPEPEEEEGEDNEVQAHYVDLYSKTLRGGINATRQSN